ncbi:MAG TPA: phosphatase PAP2 family protein [Gemmatimonadaceae bacterium]|nr:phosphatase PAP2 family protein [Gemmatimonadaceae bacterium]
MRSTVVAAIAQLLLISSSAIGQKDSTPLSPRERGASHAWIVPLGIALSTAVDPEMREWALERRSRQLDRLARLVNPLGTARSLVPAMALTYGGALLTHHESLAVGALTTAAAYAASDIVESALKPMVGRERPHVEGNSHRFRPFNSSGDWHSFPSAHVAHVTAIAEAISMQTHSTALTGICGMMVSLVAWDRIYEDQHWTSDVTATAVLSAMVSKATVGWIDSRLRRAHHGD